MAVNGGHWKIESGNNIIIKDKDNPGVFIEIIVVLKEEKTNFYH
jgi:hypothetical protein